jgi:hypothetical protein
MRISDDCPECSGQMQYVDPGFAPGSNVKCQSPKLVCSNLSCDFESFMEDDNEEVSVRKHNSDVLLICGYTEEKCQRCELRTQEVIVQLASVGHRYEYKLCKACVAHLVERAL